MGVAFLRHGWPKLRNLRTWTTALKTPEWLCFLSAASMFAGGIALIPGLLTPLAALAALAILVSMAYATVQESPAGDYAGPMGVGEPPSWEKAAMDVVMGLVLFLRPAEDLAGALTLRPPAAPAGARPPGSRWRSS
jgi:putative oxidoreductase